MSDLTVDQVLAAMKRAKVWPHHISQEDGAARLHEELTKPEPEYVLSESVARQFQDERSREATRAALDAVARQIVEEIVERAAKGRDYVRVAGVYVSSTSLIERLAQGLPESRSHA